MRLRLAGVAALVGAPLALVDGRGVAATIGTLLVGVAALTVWLSVAFAAVRGERGSRRDNGAHEPVVAEEETTTAAHRADRPRPRPPWYSGVEVSFDLAA